MEEVQAAMRVYEKDQSGKRAKKENMGWGRELAGLKSHLKFLIMFFSNLSVVFLLVVLVGLHQQPSSLPGTPNDLYFHP